MKLDNIGRDMIGKIDTEGVGWYGMVWCGWRSRDDVLGVID